MQKALIVILGPTGIGKSRVAVDLALRTGTEIISADSRQFYREMSIGTAVPPAEDLARVKHHLVQHLSVKDYYSASLFEADVLTRLDLLFTQYNHVIMTGGSGLYIDAVCGSIDEIPDIDLAVRKKYLERFDSEGIESLRKELKSVDPIYYSATDFRNPKRILRALEIYWSTGSPYSSYLNRGGKKRPFPIIKAGLELSRNELYARIDRRVDDMVEAGLEQEAQSLLPLREYNALNTVGYREFFRFFDGEITRGKAIELIKRNSRRYAKRQITWWARDNDIEWFSPGDIDGIIQLINSAVQKK